MITLVTAQELAANLGDDDELRGWRDRCIDEIERLFVKPDIECVMESVAPDGSIVDHFDGRTLNPGHAIEAAWFIMHEGALRNDSRMIRLGCQMLDWMWARGWDEEHGGIFYFRDVFDKPVQEYWHDMKFWWPHDEALIATLMAWKLTGEARYLEWHEQVRAWSFQHFADPQHGEWFGYLHRDGSPIHDAQGQHVEELLPPSPRPLDVLANRLRKVAEFLQQPIDLSASSFGETRLLCHRAAAISSHTRSISASVL